MNKKRRQNGHRHKRNLGTFRCEDPDCSLCSSGGIMELIEMLSGGMLSEGMPGSGMGMPIGIPRKLLEMLSEGMPGEGMPGSGMGMPIAAIPGLGGMTLISLGIGRNEPDDCDPDCDHPDCQKRSWAKKDCPDIGIAFEEGGPVFVFRPQDHRKVDELLELLEQKEHITNDIAVWERILKGDPSAWDDLSYTGKRWLKNIAAKTLEAVHDDDDVGAGIICDNVGRIDDFIVLFDKNPFKNELLKDRLEHIRKTAGEDMASEIDEKIEAAKAELPVEHRDTTEPLEVHIPVDVLEKMVMDWSKKQTSSDT